MEVLHQSQMGGILHSWTLNMYHDVSFFHHFISASTPLHDSDFWGIAILANSHFGQVRDVHRLERIGAEAWKIKR